MKQLTLEWIDKAEGDYRVVLALRRQKRPVYDAICYHAQQCAEKYLKAWLVEQNISFPRIHDVEALMKMCLLSLPDLGDQIAAAIDLTNYAVEIRYPGLSATKADADVSWKAARAIRKMLRQKLDI